MVNVIQTIKNLKNEFPRFQIDTILKIVECISEDELSENGLLIEPTKNHLKDRTSKNTKIITEE